MSLAMEDTLRLGQQGVNPEVACRRVVVQQRQRLYREGVTQLLSSEPDVEVVAAVMTEAELVLACQEHLPDVALIEVDPAVMDSHRVIAALRRSQPRLVVIGLAASAATMEQTTRARRGGMSTVVGRDAGIAGILTALRTSNRAMPNYRQSALTAPPPQPSMLTGRELEILSLVGAGLTSVAISTRLHISHKTVENHKQRMFAKLGVQNQAHAVSVAIRGGLLRPDRVVETTLGEAR
jgi:DNA-binding NarL/FixJ family response regulator